MWVISTVWFKTTMILVTLIITITNHVRGGLNPRPSAVIIVACRRSYQLWKTIFTIRKQCMGDQAGSGRCVLILGTLFVITTNIMGGVLHSRQIILVLTNCQMPYQLWKAVFTIKKRMKDRGRSGRCILKLPNPKIPPLFPRIDTFLIPVSCKTHYPLVWWSRSIPLHTLEQTVEANSFIWTNQAWHDQLRDV